MQNYWPGFVYPEKNELFSSWYLRICDQHKIKSHSFSKFYLRSTSIWNRDIDQYCPQELKNMIRSATPLTADEINDMFMDSYDGYVFNGGIKRKAISELGIYHRKRTSYGLVFCPGCLEKKIPIFKKDWRLVTSLVCTKCNLYLLDRCRNCKSPVSFHRLEAGHKSSLLEQRMSICWNCNVDLRTKSFFKANQDYITYQIYINDTIMNGYNDKYGYSFLYFDVLISLNNKIFTESKMWNRFKIAVEKDFNLMIGHLDRRNIVDRRISYFLCYQLLENWPLNFKLFCERNNIRLSDFSKDLDYVPFWFEKAFKPYIDS